MKYLKNPSRIILIVFVLTALQGLIDTPRKFFFVGEDFIHPIVHFTVAFIGIILFWRASRRTFLYYGVAAGAFFLSLAVLGLLQIYPHWMPLGLADNVFHIIYSTFVILVSLWGLRESKR